MFDFNDGTVQALLARNPWSSVSPKNLPIKKWAISWMLIHNAGGINNQPNQMTALHTLPLRNMFSSDLCITAEEPKCSLSPHTHTVTLHLLLSLDYNSGQTHIPWGAQRTQRVLLTANCLEVRNSLISRAYWGPYLAGMSEGPSFCFKLGVMRFLFLNKSCRSMRVSSYCLGLMPEYRTERPVRWRSVREWTCGKLFFSRFKTRWA